MGTDVMDSPIDQVLNAAERLGPVKKQGDGYQVLCPAHNDRNPSLSIKEGIDGKVLLNCFAGCDPDAVVEALGLDWSDCYPPKSTSSATALKTKPKLVNIYPYHDANGDLLYERCRYEPKDFRFRRPDGAPGLNGIEQTLYGLPQVIAAVAAGETIYITEGEADCVTLETLGKVATTTGSATSWQSKFAEYFAGATVRIIPDNDPAGRNYARGIARSLDQVAAKVSASIPPTDGSDITNHVRAGGTLATLVDFDLAADVIELVPEGQPTVDEEFDRIHAIRKAKYFAQGEDFFGKLAPPDPLIDGILALNSTAMLFGKYGTGKTYVALNIGLHIATGRKFLGLDTVRAPVLFVAAERANQHEGRVKAWLKIYNEPKAPDDLGFYWAPTPYLDAGEDLHIIRIALEMGAKLIAVDTLSASMSGEESSNDDWNRFQEACNRITAATGACLLILHHPGKNTAAGARGASGMGGSITTMIEAKKGLGKTISLSDQGEHGKQAFFASGTLNHSWEFREAIVEINGESRINAALVPIGETKANNPNGDHHRTVSETIKATDDGTGLTVADVNRALIKGGVDWSPSTVKRRIDVMAAKGLVKNVGTKRRARWALDALLDDDDFDF